MLPGRTWKCGLDWRLQVWKGNENGMEAAEPVRASLLQEATEAYLSMFQDIETRRSIALRYSDAQLDEVLMLFLALERFQTECLDWISAPAGTRESRRPAFDQAFHTASAACEACQTILPPTILKDLAWTLDFGEGLPDRFPTDASPPGYLDGEMDGTFSLFFSSKADILSELLHPKSL